MRRGPPLCGALLEARTPGKLNRSRAGSGGRRAGTGSTGEAKLTGGSQTCLGQGAVLQPIRASLCTPTERALAQPGFPAVCSALVDLLMQLFR